MASSSFPSPAAEHHRLQDDDAVLSSLLLDLGRGYDDEQGVENEQDISSSTENAPALGFDARAYHQLSEYYAQPLLLTGGEPTVAQWPQVQVGEEGTKTLLSKTLDSCRVCRVTVPALVVGEEGEEDADGKKKPRLATLQEKDVEVEDLDGPESLDAVLGQADNDKKQTSHHCCNRKGGDLFYAYGALDVSPLHHQQSGDDTTDSLPPSDPAAAAFWAAFPPPACLQQKIDTDRETHDSTPTTNNTLIVAANLWVGRNLTSGLHVDALDNLFCSARGAKSCTYTVHGCSRS